MKNCKLTALILVLLMLFQALPVPAAAADDITLTPAEDTYIVSGSRWEHKNYGDAGTMLFGNAYDRTALIKFDLSDLDLTAYNGALLNITFNAASEESRIDAYAVSGDWSEKNLTYANFSGDYSFTIASEVADGAEQQLSLNLNTALAQAKASGASTLSVALKSDAGCISVFSSETSDASMRPTLTLSEDEVYVSGQYDFIYPELTQAKLKPEFQKAISKGHPRIIATPESFAKVKEYAFGKDATLTELYSYVKASSDKLLNSDIVNIDANLSAGTSALSLADTMMTNMMYLALCYNVEGDSRYAEKAYSQAEYLCNLSTWGRVAMIDNVRMLFTVCICYDWLYDWLDADQKDLLVEGARRLCLDRASDVYHNPTKAEYRSAFDQFLVSTGGNHIMQDASILAIAAITFAETDIDFMSDLMTRCMPHFLAAFRNMYPDGIWGEGPSYWRFVGPFAARLLQAMNSAFGHCFGLDEINFANHLADYPIYTTSDFGFFNVGDCHFNHTYEHDPWYFTIGHLADDSDLQSYAITGALEKKSPEPLTVLLYEPEDAYGGEMTLATDKLFRGAMSQATMRYSFEGDQNMFVGMNVRENLTLNAHADAGTLALDALGERWITNNSKEVYYAGYAGTKERWTWYRTRAEGNSCIVINPSEEVGQELFRGLRIDSFKSEPGGAYAIADLTRAYEQQAESYKRGIQLTDNRKVFVVQDELVLKEPSEVYSFFNIWDADIEILDDGKSAIISKNNKKVYVTIDCDQEFTLSRMLADPLPTSPKPNPSKPNTPNADFLKLALHFDSIESANIRVCFMPYICDEELESITCKEFVPMSDWTAPSEMKAPPQLIDIKIGGKSIEGFNPYNRCYETESKVSKEEITASYDNTKYDVTIRNADRDGVVNILVVDKNDKTNINSYLIGMPVLPEPSFVDTSDMSVLTITKCTAPESQEGYGVDKLFDDDFSTRWSENGAGKVMNIQLDKVRKVGCIAVATYMENDARRQNFDVELSLDGKTWTHVGRFRSSGMTLEPEYYDLGNTEAAYVRVTWNSSNVSGWNSITELKLYGK